MLKPIANNPEARQQYVETRAAIIKHMMLARNSPSWENRILRRMFGIPIDPASIVDTFDTVSGEDRKFGVTEPGHYFFDDRELRYHGPFKTREEAITAASEHLLQ